MASSDRPLPLERVCASNSIQDGDQPVGSPCSSETRLYGLQRPEGCLPSGSNSSREQEVSSVRGLREGLPVQGPLLRAVHGPQVFTRVMALVSSFLHSLGIRILLYLDDWLILTLSLSEALWAKDIMLDLCHQLGIEINLDKSHLTPPQSVTYLGMVLKNSILKAFPALEQVSALQSQIEEFLSYDRQSVVLWRSLLGHLSFLCHLVPGGCLRMRSLQLVLLASWDFLDESV